MDITSFLQRIGYAGPVTPDEATLRAIHRAFVTAIPFENLDIHLRRRIVLDESRVFEKIVTHWRGGFCYELNGLFAAALRQLGFDVTLLSGRVYDSDGELGREFVHLLLLVRLDSRWIADVGFGDWSAEPLCLETQNPQLIDDVAFRVIGDGSVYVIERRSPTDDCWKPRYSFTLTARRLSDFAEMCEHLQTAADSAFRRQRMCTRGTSDGRVTLTEDRLIITSRGKRTEVPVRDRKEYSLALAEHFQINLREEEIG